MKRGMTRWALAAAPALLATMLAVVPATPAAASDVVPVKSEQLILVGGPTDYWWDQCQSASLKTEWIYLESFSESCGTGQGHVVGFASLRTNSATSHTLEVCSFQAETVFSEIINQANPDGSSSGTQIPYTVTGIACVLPGTKGYRMRKFHAYSACIEATGGPGCWYAGSFWVNPYPA